MGRDLRKIGVDVDFAPVADLALDPHNTVIGARAFGSDPSFVGTMASAVARGLRRGGVAATAKHFPGHGATAIDSHLALPTVDVDGVTLRSREFVPFRACIAEGIDAVMVGHLLARALDPERPASISRVVVTDVLRGELGFSGAVFTDCIEMDAVAATIGSPRAAVAALAAGVDAVIVSHHLEVAHSIVEEILSALRDGRLTSARLEEAASRLGRLAARPSVDSSDDPTIGFEIARRAVTVVRGTVELGAQAVTVISFEGSSADGVGDIERASLNEALRRRGIKSEIMRVPVDPQPDDVRLLLSVVEGLGERAFVIVTRRADLHSGQRAAVDALARARPHAIVISAREPCDAALFGVAESVACIYGDQAVSFEGLAELMAPRVR
jgi:beta-N-acetylhexosaminidase